MSKRHPILYSGALIVLLTCFLSCTFFRNKVYASAVEGLTMHSSPQKDAEIISTIPYGEHIAILDIYSYWAKVAFKKKQGWIDATWLSAKRPAPRDSIETEIPWAHDGQLWLSFDVLTMDVNIEKSLQAIPGTPDLFCMWSKPRFESFFLEDGEKPRNEYACINDDQLYYEGTWRTFSIYRLNSSWEVLEIYGENLEGHPEVIRWTSPYRAKESDWLFSLFTNIPVALEETGLEIFPYNRTLYLGPGLVNPETLELRKALGWAENSYMYERPGLTLYGGLFGGSEENYLLFTISAIRDKEKIPQNLDETFSVVVLAQHRGSGTRLVREVYRCNGLSFDYEDNTYDPIDDNTIDWNGEEYIIYHGSNNEDSYITFLPNPPSGGYFDFTTFFVFEDGGFVKGETKEVFLLEH